VTYNPTDVQPASRGDTSKKCPNQAGCTFKRFLSIEMTSIWWIWANDRPEFPQTRIFRGFFSGIRGFRENTNKLHPRNLTAGTQKLAICRCFSFSQVPCEGIQGCCLMEKWSNCWPGSINNNKLGNENYKPLTWFNGYFWVDSLTFHHHFKVTNQRQLGRISPDSAAAEAHNFLANFLSPKKTRTPIHPPSRIHPNIQKRNKIYIIFSYPQHHCTLKLSTPSQ